MSRPVERVPLSRGLYAIVYADDFPLVADYTWHARPITPEAKSWYAVRKGGEGEPATVYMHRQLLDAPKGVVVDHADRNGLNNRRSNLRATDRYGNAQNSVHRGSGFRGIFFQRGLWRAEVRANGKRERLGYFYSAVDAARAYDAAARRLHGEFARLNFAESRDWLALRAEEAAWPPRFDGGEAA